MDGYISWKEKMWRRNKDKEGTSINFKNILVNFELQINFIEQ